MDVLRDRPQLLVSEAAEGVLHHLEVLVEVTGPFGVGQLRQGGRSPVRHDEVMRGRELGRIGAPQLLASDQLGDELGDRVGHERAGDSGFDVALGAVVEQRASGLDGSRVGHVVGEHLVVVDRPGGGERDDPVVYDRAGEIDGGRGGGEVGLSHGPERLVTGYRGPSNRASEGDHRRDLVARDRR